MIKGLKKQILSDFFDYFSEKYGPNPLVAFVGQEPISYDNFSFQVRKVKYFLKECDIREGQKVVLLGDNSPHWGIAYFAITTLGAVVVPILSEFPEADINHIIKHSEAKAVFIDDKSFQTLDLSALDTLSIVIGLEKFTTLKGTPNIESISPEKVTKHSQMKDIEEDQLAEILYTSGTTGHSKGVMLTHKNIISNALSGPARLGGLDESSILLNILPLAHAYGCTTSFLGAFSVGASIYFLDKKPSPKILMDAMQQVRPTLVTGVPLIFEKIYHKRVLPELTNRKSLRFVSSFNFGRKLLYRKIGKRILESFGGRLYSFIIGGASLNREVEIFLREAKIPFAIGYGLSECAPLVSGDYYNKLKIGSVGRIIQDVQVKIIDPNAETGIGEICVRGPNVMLGYYKNDKETSKVFTRDGWLKTGDLGFLDSEGYLFIKGRSKNVYVGASGENIYPEIVEDRLRESRFVEEALVYMDGDTLIGRVYLDYEYIQNLYQVKNNPVQPDEIDKILEDIRREMNLKLPPFSQIKRIFEQIEPFVKTPTNKIKRILYIPDYEKN